jgi:hypothetical protein
MRVSAAASLLLLLFAATALAATQRSPVVDSIGADAVEDTDDQALWADTALLDRRLASDADESASGGNDEDVMTHMLVDALDNVS